MEERYKAALREAVQAAPAAGATDSEISSI